LHLSITSTLQNIYQREIGHFRDSTGIPYLSILSTGKEKHNNQEGSLKIKGLSANDV